MTSETPMPVCALLLWIAAGGSLGGIARFLTELELKSESHTVSSLAHERKTSLLVGTAFLTGRTFIGLLLASAVIGLCGAAAIQFMLILLGSFRGSAAAPDQLFIFSISAAAGFAARQLMPRIGVHLQNQVATLQERVREQSEVNREQERTLSLETLFTRYESAILPHSLPSHRMDLIGRFKEALADDPDDRYIVFRLTKLLKLQKQYSTALEYTEAFLMRLEEGGKQASREYADALYNKACYKTLIWGETGEEADRAAALQALAKSIELYPLEADDARVDEDFKRFRETNDPEFKALVKA